MSSSGYRWSLRLHGGGWQWRVEGRDDLVQVDGGLAPTRATAAALMIRAIARASTRPPRGVSA